MPDAFDPPAKTGILVPGPEPTPEAKIADVPAPIPAATTDRIISRYPKVIVRTDEPFFAVDRRQSDAQLWQIKTKYSRCLGTRDRWFRFGRQFTTDPIGSYIAETNCHPKPFVWTKTADDVLADVAPFCQRTSNLKY